MQTHARHVNYENLFLAYNFSIENYEPTRISSALSTCLDQCDHVAVLRELPLVKLERTPSHVNQFVLRTLETSGVRKD